VDLNINEMTDTMYDVIIIGGSYAGLSAGMALGRSLRNVLIIDSGQPCNIQTPHSHNFLTRDGETPQGISAIARAQVEKYETVAFYSGLAVSAGKKNDGFEVITSAGDRFSTRKLVLATGVKDIIPDIEGFAPCWGISILHCPYCHGYEVRNQTTGILGNGEYAFEFSKLILNWTKDLTLFTDGRLNMTAEQQAQLTGQISIVEKEISSFEHSGGQIKSILFKDGTRTLLSALYARPGFEQHSGIPADLGCQMTAEGYVDVDMFQKTSVPGVYACGDNTTRMRSVSSAVASGTVAAAVVNKELVDDQFAVNSESGS
jgi:thioredoxin reductase